MITLLAQHVAIVLQAQREGVTERDDLIAAVTKWHRACNDLEWTEKKSAKLVDLALAAIKLKEQNEHKS